MKKYLTILVAIIGYSTVCIAQSNFVATLSHDGNFTHYYGSGALQSAYNASEDGDIITLSPGTFSLSGMYKAITLRGTGIDATKSSVISSVVDIIPKYEGEIVIEGVRFSGGLKVYNDYSIEHQGKIKLIKNSINSLGAYTSNTSSTYSEGPIVRLYNNNISSLTFYDKANPDYMFYNCIIAALPSYNAQTTTAFVNCIINFNTYGSGLSYNMNYYNCIFRNSNTATADSYLARLSNTTTSNNCVATGSNYGVLFSSLLSGANNKYVAPSALFEQNNVLTETAKQEYLGLDGTEVGIYGGNYPYDSKVQYPIITQFSSDVQTSKEGILNINVEVDGQ